MLHSCVADVTGSVLEFDISAVVQAVNISIVNICARIICIHTIYIHSRSGVDFK